MTTNDDSAYIHDFGKVSLLTEWSSIHYTHSWKKKGLEYKVFFGEAKS